MSRDAKTRWRAWVVLVVAVLAGQVLWIALLRGPRLLDHELTLILGQLFLCMGLIAIAGLISTTPADAIKLPRPQSRWIILGGTVLFQFIGLLLLWPALSSDVVRYRIEGLSWIAGRSPYVHPPETILLTDSADAIDRTVSAKEMPSIYPPVAQTVFLATRAVEMVVFGPAKLDGVKPDATVHNWRAALPRLSFWHRAILLRAVFSLAAVASVLVMVSILDAAHQTPWLAVMFAWNPLLVLETAGNGHVDIVGVLFVLVMIGMVQKRNYALATIALCLACGVKPLAIVLAPVIIQQVYDRKSWLVARRCVGVAAITLAIVFLPVLLVQHGYRGWLHQLGMYARFMQFNALLPALGKSLFGSAWLGSVTRGFSLALLPLGLIALLLWALRRRLPIADAAYWLMLTALLLGSVASPWMILWPLCFAPLLRRSTGWAALTWTATASLAYAVWQQSTPEVPTRIVMAEYAPVLLALGVQIRELMIGRAPAKLPKIVISSESVA